MVLVLISGGRWLGTPPPQPRCELYPRYPVLHVYIVGDTALIGGVPRHYHVSINATFFKVVDPEVGTSQHMSSYDRLKGRNKLTTDH